MNVQWMAPYSVPVVKEGTEELYWIAVENDQGKQFVFAAHYQNRPINEDEDWCLYNEDGEPHHSVGWVEMKEHHEFDGYYSQITFNEHYKLLGWAEYEVPVFTGVSGWRCR